MTVPGAPAMQQTGRGVTWWRRSLLVVAAIATVSSCGGDDANTVPFGADAYTAVIDEFLPPIPSDTSRPVVYVVRLGENPFELEDQVAMIDAVQENYDLRFVDTVAAAIDDRAADASPRDGGVLLGIGTISTAVPHAVRVEVYTAAGGVDAHKLTLTVRGAGWQVDSSESVDPEVLVSDE